MKKYAKKRKFIRKTPKSFNQRVLQAVLRTSEKKYVDDVGSAAFVNTGALDQLFNALTTTAGQGATKITRIGNRIRVGAINLQLTAYRNANTAQNVPRLSCRISIVYPKGATLISAQCPLAQNTYWDPDLVEVLYDHRFTLGEPISGTTVGITSNIAPSTVMFTKRFNFNRIINFDQATQGLDKAPYLYLWANNSDGFSNYDYSIRSYFTDL